MAGELCEAAQLCVFILGTQYFSLGVLRHALGGGLDMWLVYLSQGCLNWKLEPPEQILVTEESPWGIQVHKTFGKDHPASKNSQYLFSNACFSTKY